MPWRRRPTAFRANSGQSVEYALASRSFSSAQDLPDGVSPNGRAMAESRLRARQLPCGTCTVVSTISIGDFFMTPIRKASDNDKYRTGSLVACERKVAFERRRRRLHELVCPDGSGKRAAMRASIFRFRRASSRAGSRRITPSAFSPAGRPKCPKCIASILACAPRCVMWRRPRMLPTRSSTRAVSNGRTTARR